MFEGKSTKKAPDHAAAGYSYPGDLARFVLDRWGAHRRPTPRR
jgi:hypothetical protein